MEQSLAVQILTVAYRQGIHKAHWIMLDINLDSVPQNSGESTAR